jgi:hypothetical protein
MSYIIVAILLFIGYRFVTGFLWPVYKATSQVKKHFQTMQENMHNPGGNHAYPTSPESEKPKFDLGGEYIHYEEIKEK